MEVAYIKVKLIVMNKFLINKFFPQFKAWIFTTLLLVVITWSYLPELVNSFLYILQKHPYLASFAVFLIYFLFYVFFIMLRFASEFHRTYCENVKNIDKSLWNCYLKFVVEDRKIISDRIHDLQSASGGDLIWETHGLELTVCEKNTCKSTWPFKGFMNRVSTRRRNRMIAVGLSYLNWRDNTCLAVETHLKEILSDGTKFLADCNYREKQIKEIRKRSRIIKLFSKLDIRRIIIIKESDWMFLKKNHLANLKKYLQWHIDNYWDAILYVMEDNPNTLTLSSIHQLPSSEYDDFSDFLIIKEIHDDNCTVFAQNSYGHARIIEEPGIGVYNEWFNSVWEFGLENLSNIPNKGYWHINQAFVNNV